MVLSLICRCGPGEVPSLLLSAAVAWPNACRLLCLSGADGGSFQVQAASMKSGYELSCWMHILDMGGAPSGRRLCDELRSGLYGSAMVLQSVLQPPARQVIISTESHVHGPK